MSSESIFQWSNEFIYCYSRAGSTLTSGIDVPERENPPTTAENPKASTLAVAYLNALGNVVIMNLA